MNNLDILKDLLNDIKLEKFKIIESKVQKTSGKTKVLTRVFHDVESIKKDFRYEISKSTLQELYFEKGYGIKYMIKYLELPVSYSVLRVALIKIFNFTLRSDKDITDNLRKLRKDKANNEFKNKIGWFGLGVQEKIKNKNHTSRGIQGYYFNKSLNKYVWLRSSWEYIYAKWLDEKNIIWDVEVKIFKLNENTSYKPDFFIYNKDNEIIQIVEIKGFWKDKVYKYDELKLLLNIDLVLITDMTPYTTNINKDITHWKKIRIMNYENKRNEN